jgi:hypothetical protein
MLCDFEIRTSRQPIRHIQRVGSTRRGPTVDFALDRIIIINIYPLTVSFRFYNLLQIPVTGAFSHQFPNHLSISFLQFHSSSPFLAFLWHHDLFRWRRRKSSSISRIRSPLRGLWQGIPIINDSISIFFLSIHNMILLDYKLGFSFGIQK